MSSLLHFSTNKVPIISVTGKHLITFTQHSSMTVTMSQWESSILAQTMVLTSNVWYWLATVLAETWLQQFLIILQWSLRSTVDGIFLELRYVVVKLRTENCLMQNINSCYLALINRAGGLYGRILTEVVSTDRTQWGLYTQPRSRFFHTDRLSSVNKMFIIWQKQEQFNLFKVTGFRLLTFWLRMAMSRS